jgi:hypothetical protein
MNSVLAGLMLSFERLRRTSTVLVCVIALVLAALTAILERRSEPALAADRALQGAIFGALIPLLAYGAVGLVTARQRFANALAPLAGYGADRKLAILGVVAGVAGAVSLFSAVLAAVGVVSAYGAGSPRLVADLLASSWIGLFAGAAYTAWFSLAANFGKTGSGRTWALLVDFLLGGGTSLLAAPWPRGHLRNLLGGEPVLGFSQPFAVLFVALLCAAYMSLAVIRLPR